LVHTVQMLVAEREREEGRKMPLFKVYFIIQLIYKLVTVLSLASSSLFYIAQVSRDF